MCSISRLLSLQALQGCILTHANIQTIQQSKDKERLPDMTFCKTFSQTPVANWIYMFILKRTKQQQQQQNQKENPTKTRKKTPNTTKPNKKPQKTTHTTKTTQTPKT